MKKLTTLVLTLAAVGSLAFLAACPPLPPPGAVYVSIPPPSAEVEVVGVAPGPEFVWIGGYHRWTGSAYVWVPGRWERRPHGGAVWVAGHWARHRRGWYWIEGRWR